jgi:hypothetical protein
VIILLDKALVPWENNWLFVTSRCEILVAS